MTLKFRSALRGLARPVTLLYGRFLEKPFRAGAEIAACCGLVVGGWSGAEYLIQRPNRAYLQDNGYSLDTEGFRQAITRRDGPAVDRFKWSGVDAPSPAVLCTEYGSVEDLAFLLDKGLISPRQSCGSAVEGTLEGRAVATLCLPSNGDCDPGNDVNIRRIEALERICRSVPCPRFEAAIADARRRIDALRSGPAARLLSNRGVFVAECLASRLGAADRRAQFGGMIQVQPVPVRYNLDAGGGPAQIPASYESMEACVGTPAAGYEEWGWIEPATPRYGVGYCVPIPAERRAQQCGQQWDFAREQLARLSRLRTALR